jgi:Na+-translocating ferredoxin:NAD+ oxidoreductase RnfC subunit
LDAGVLVTNVGTMLNIYEASLNKPVIYKYISILGEVKYPCIVKVPIGITVDECIQAVEGVTVKDYCLILGGPMMGRIIESRQTKDEVVTKTLSSIIVLPEEHCIAENRKTPIKSVINRIKTSCIQCSMCTELCPRYLIGHKLRPHKIMRSVGFEDNNEEVLKEALICCECGVCELYACPMGLSPRMMNVDIKNKLRKQGVSYNKENEVPQANSMRSYRKIPVSRLLARLDLSKYTNQYLDGVKDIKTNKVTIMFKQHIGKPAVPLVSVGEKVAKGQLIAHVRYEDIGANVHSSIDGEVDKITDDKIIICNNNRR